MRRASLVQRRGPFASYVDGIVFVREANGPPFFAVIWTVKRVMDACKGGSGIVVVDVRVLPLPWCRQIFVCFDFDLWNRLGLMRGLPPLRPFHILFTVDDNGALRLVVLDLPVRHRKIEIDATRDEHFPCPSTALLHV